MSLVEHSSLKSLGVREMDETSFWEWQLSLCCGERGVFQGPRPAVSAPRHSQALGRLVGSLVLLKSLNTHD